jgi:hypothetical protein
MKPRARNSRSLASIYAALTPEARKRADRYLDELTKKK